MKTTTYVLAALAALLLVSPATQAQTSKAEQIERYRQICPPKFSPPSPAAVQTCTQLWAVISAMPDDDDDADEDADAPARPAPGGALGPAPTGPDYDRGIREHCNGPLTLDRQRICNEWRARAAQSRGSSSSDRAARGSHSGNAGQGSFEPVTQADHPCVQCRQTIRPGTQQDAYHCENQCSAPMSLRVCNEKGDCTPWTLRAHSGEWVGFRKGGRWSHQVIGVGR